MATMNEIARLARVSVGTVSNVLNGSTTVREPLRRRVLETVERLGYRPSQLARGLRRDKTDIIGMIIPDVSNPFFPAVVRGTEDTIFAAGYHLVLCNTDNDHSKELTYFETLRTYLPTGLIIIPSTSSMLTQQTQAYRKSGGVVVCVDRLARDWDGDSVVVANEEGAYQATRLLVENRHSRIAAIVGPLYLTSSRDRLAGYKRALIEAGLPSSPSLIQASAFSQQGGYTKALALLRMLPRPTAFFAGDDVIAIGILLAIRESGLRCPEDISLIGFDDLDFTEATNPALSTVHQPGYQLGASAARLLLDRVGGYTGPPKRMVLKTELKIRESVAALTHPQDAKGDVPGSSDTQWEPKGTRKSPVEKQGPVKRATRSRTVRDGRKPSTLRPAK